jgi:Nucleotidyltransferase domain
VKELKRRRSATKKRLAALRTRLVDAEARAGDRACVYATGSFGRGEASDHSDLDLFIVGRDVPVRNPPENRARSQLRYLDEICIKADLISATKSLNIPEFSGDGQYLTHFPGGSGRSRGLFNGVLVLKRVTRGQPSASSALKKPKS